MTLREWSGAEHRYRLRVVAGQAVYERSIFGKGPWRRMLQYPRHVIEQLAEAVAGPEWRAVGEDGR